MGCEGSPRPTFREQNLDVGRTGTFELVGRDVASSLAQETAVIVSVTRSQEGKGPTAGILAQRSIALGPG